MNQLGELQQYYSQFRALGAEMYGISVDAPDVSKRQIVQRLGVQFPILSDQTRETIKAYDVYDRIANIAKPATFVIDKDGLIQWKDIGEHKADRVFSDQVIQQLTGLNQPENRPPAISPAIPNLGTEGGRPLIIDLSDYATDDQDASGNLSWRLDRDDNPIFQAAVDRHLLTIEPSQGTYGTAKITLTLVDSQDEAVSQTVRVTVTPEPGGQVEFMLTVPEGISLFHLLLSVTGVNGEPRTIDRVSHLFDLLGGSANVYWLITTQPATADRPGQFQVFFMHSPENVNLPANVMLEPNTGILASVRQTVQLNLIGAPLDGELHLHPGPNVIGVPHYNAGIHRLSDFVQLEDVRDTVTLIAIYTDGGFQAFHPDAIIPGDANDLEIGEGQALIVIAKESTVIRFE